MSARLLTRAGAVATICERWRAQYFHSGEWIPCVSGSQAVYDRLAALDRATATAADVDRVIGNDSWTHFWCDVCASFVVEAVEFSPDAESDSDATTTLCRACLTIASALLPAEVSP